AGCDREADGRVPGWEGCARANRGTTDVVRSVVARRVTVPCAAAAARGGVRRRASTCGRPCPRQRWEVQDEPPRRDRAGGRVGNIRAGRATDGPPEWRRRRSSTGSSPMPPTHRYRFAGCRTRRTDAREASARFWRGRAFSPAGPYDLTAGAQEGPGAQVTHEVMGAVHRPGQAGPPPHDRGAGAAGPLLLAVPTDSATSAAPRPCAVPQTLGQDQRRGVLAGQVLEGDVDCVLRAPIARRRRPTRRQGDAVTSQIDRSRSVAASRRRRTSVPHADTDRSVPRRTRSHESVDRCGLPTEVAACDARAAGLDRD